MRSASGIPELREKIEAQEATIQGLVRALEDVTELLCATVNEFGCWTPHDHPKVRAANEALKSVRGNLQ